MLRSACAVLWGLMLALPALAAEPPPITGDEGATYADLIREGKLVTIMLKTGAPEYNLRIKGIHPKEKTPTIEVETSSGERTAHTFANISSVRVQKERVRTEDKPDPETALTKDDKEIVKQALDRALAIFKEQRNQAIKMSAAAILAASTHPNKADAIAYLKSLRESNDAATAMLAAAMLWQVGEAPPDAVLLAGLTSGNRLAKSLAAELVGLTKTQKFIVEVRGLLKDRSPEIFPSAARAIGKLNDRSSLPILYEALHVITDEKAEAAAIALVDMGGPDVIQKLQEMLPAAKGTEWYRIVRTLHLLGDKNATHLLESKALGLPVCQREAALLLAKDGNTEAMKFLREYLKKQADPDAENLIYRARVGLTLYAAGDIQAKSIIGEVLGIQPNDVYARGRTDDKQFKEGSARLIQIKVSQLLGQSMRRDLLPALVPPLQSSDPTVAITAGLAIMYVANRDFGKRAIESDH